MPDSLPHEDDAGLYVLDLLDPEAKRTFERQLAASPDLQQHVAGLQASLEALALAPVPCPPPARVWNAIARRTAEIPVAVGTAAPVWAWIRRLLVSGWAVAAVLAVMLAAHLQGDRSRRLASAGSLDSAPLPGGAGDPSSRGSVVGGEAGTAPSGRDPRRVGTIAGDGARSDSRPAPDAARLQDRVRFLSDQVATLNRVLTQRAVVPAGAARLQVFRLVGSNATHEVSLPPAPTTAATEHRQTTAPGSKAGSPVVEASTDVTTGTVPDPILASAAGPDFALTLALAAARQLASLPPLSTTPNRAATAVEVTGRAPATADTALAENSAAAMATPGVTDGTVAASEPAAGQGSIQILDLASPTGPATTVAGTDSAAAATPGVLDSPIVSATDGAAFGAYSLDTGSGAIAFRAPANADGSGAYQLWVSDGSTGLVQSVGYASPPAIIFSNQVIVLKFNFDAASFSSPSFMITKEPTGGSTLPTGIILAQPPTTVPVQPVP